MRDGVPKAGQHRAGRGVSKGSGRSQKPATRALGIDSACVRGGGSPASVRVEMQPARVCPFRGKFSCRPSRRARQSGRAGNGRREDRAVCRRSRRVPSPPDSSALDRTDRACGRLAIGFQRRLPVRRAITRRTLPSTAAWGRPKAMLAMRRRCNRRFPPARGGFVVAGKSPRRTICARLSADFAPANSSPSPLHIARTFLLRAPRRAPRIGKAARNRS